MYEKLEKMYLELQNFEKKFPEFAKLHNDKKERIISAALEEFALHGYVTASTNIIVTKAKIGKGMLFTYFKSKKDLFLFLCNRVTSMFLVYYDDMVKKMLQQKKDIFELAIVISYEKLKFLKKFPIESQFLMIVYSKLPEEIAEDIKEYQNFIFSLSMNLFFAMADFSTMRKDIDHTIARDIILFVFDGIQKKILSAAAAENMNFLDTSFEKDFFEMRAQTLKYIEILKYGMYE